MMNPFTRLALVLTLLLSTETALARVGFGDPMAVYRDRQPGESSVWHGYLRLRSAAYQNLNLVEGSTRSPSGQILWPTGSDATDRTGGADMRMRLGGSIFVASDLRFIVEADLLDNVTLGATPRGTPMSGRYGIVAGTQSQTAYSLHDTLRLRIASAEVLTPLGVLSAGRSASHFGLGIAANDGAGLDDDSGDLADRIAFTAPFMGHFLSVAFDWAASGATLLPHGRQTELPNPQMLSDGLRSISFSFLHFRAPWEVELYRQSNRPVLDYGIAVTHQWQQTDVPAYYDSLDAELAQSETMRVDRGYRAWAVDTWCRLVTGTLRLEAEAIAIPFSIQNPSTQAGIAYTTPTEGLPYGATLVLEWTPSETARSLLWEVGFASADAAYGFPFHGPTSSTGGAPGDYFGTQVTGADDLNINSFRFHPSYQVDLILWRTLLGGVSEAAYARTRVRDTFLDTFTLEAAAIYSHGLKPASNPGGIAPLGVEADLSALVEIGQFSARLDYGLLFPLGGLAIRGNQPNSPAQLLMMRLGYEAS